jgi:hypothetical protein
VALKELKDKICKTCVNRLPKVTTNKISTVPHATPVTGCEIDRDVTDTGVCDFYRNLWTEKNGIYGKPPQGRPSLI